MIIKNPRGNVLNFDSTDFESVYYCELYAPAADKIFFPDSMGSSSGFRFMLFRCKSKADNRLWLCSRSGPQYLIDGEDVEKFISQYKKLVEEHLQSLRNF